MKILTANFVTCAVKACKASPLAFPLHFHDAELEQQDMEYSPAFLRNILPRIEWDALRTTAAELGFSTLPEAKPEFTSPEAVTGQAAAATAEIADSGENASGIEGKEMEGVETGTEAALSAGQPGPATVGKGEDQEEVLLRELHKLLVETQVVEGKMLCGNCGHEYKIKEGIANFLLPNHLV